MMEVFKMNFESYDGGDTGFLNHYFDDWYSKKDGRLAFKYNAQRYMYDVTYKKQSGYWDKGVGEAVILHYSSTPKPWDKKRGDNDLDNIWWNWYERSQNPRSEKRTKSTNVGTQRVQGSGHVEVAKRYKELRKEGMGVKEAMEQARKEVGVFGKEENAGSKVAAMFGMA
eukprot:CAMPEP_0172515548 /NCGR_PEP_ID=MMETSP1066-20121228/268805_1 /TAXON_ID=671091 /ORGANISM="Coscinodiscus wailesii, Strain CCMP2513" /LENGTH=168 /DNA_ID=CAMNT_0013296637 /DNA_START=562 /DNA_END=1068 /DNA_ORIENTATION=+